MPVQTGLRRRGPRLLPLKSETGRGGLAHLASCLGTTHRRRSRYDLKFQAGAKRRVDPTCESLPILYNGAMIDEAFASVIVRST